MEKNKFGEVFFPSDEQLKFSIIPGLMKTYIDIGVVEVNKTPISKIREGKLPFTTAITITITINYNQNYDINYNFNHCSRDRNYNHQNCDHSYNLTSIAITNTITAQTTINLTLTRA